MLEYFKKIAQEYNVSLIQVLSIALNRYGIIINDFLDSRIRFYLRFIDSNRDDFFAVCVNTYLKSPFKLENNKLYLDNEIIGQVHGIEKDTCTSTYFRNDKKAITFNSNSRSKCAGCAFCGTYSLTEDDNYDFKSKDNIKEYFNKLLLDNEINSMRDLEDVTICTGCFDSENQLVNHILLVNEAFKEMDFSGRINYIGSQLRDYEKIKKVYHELGDFGLYLTIEKFLDREKYMRPEKANLTLDMANDLLKYTSNIGISSTFLYILGLEDLDVIKKYFQYFKDSINKFPIVQIYQDYTPEQEQYRCESAKDIKYYLEARKIINDIFSNSKLEHRLWESFRGINYDKNIGGVLCKKKV